MPESQSRTFSNTTPVAHASTLMRPKGHRPMHKQLTINHLPLCPKKAEISGLMRPSSNSDLTTHTPPGGADLTFVRHLEPLQARNLITPSYLPLCLKKREIPRLLRPPHATTYNPPNDADLASVRHQRPVYKRNPLTISHLPLCAKKRRISGLLRHRPSRASRTTNASRMTNASRTVHNRRFGCFEY